MSSKGYVLILRFLSFWARLGEFENQVSHKMLSGEFTLPPRRPSRDRCLGWPPPFEIHIDVSAEEKRKAQSDVCGAADKFA
jgi:hypothetical protein